MKIQTIRHSATRLADLRFNRRVIALALIVASITSCQQVDATPAVGHNRAVLFNISTSFSRLNTMADSRHAAIFTSVRNAIGTPSLSGRGVGHLRVCRFHSAGLLTHAMRPAPSFSSDGPSLTLTMEAIHHA